MVNEYKKIILLHGLQRINDYHFRLVKSLLASELRISQTMQEEYDRIKFANLMEAKFQGATCVDKLIEVIKDIPELKDIVKKVRREKLKVEKGEVLLDEVLPSVAETSRAKGKTPVKRRNLDGAGSATPSPPAKDTLTSRGAEAAPVAQKRKKTTKENNRVQRKKAPQKKAHPTEPGEPSTSTTMGFRPPSQTSPGTASSTSSAKNPTPQTQPKEDPSRNLLQKGPVTVMVLKATKLFKYMTPENRENTVFHATVATETDIIYVKVFNTHLKKKFTSKKIITISDYFKHQGFLEVRENSSVIEVDRKFDVLQETIRTATKTPQIITLHTQTSGTIVNGLFTLNKKTVNKGNTIYEIEDRTGKMDVIGKRYCHNITCEEGDKLQLICFRLQTENGRRMLVSEMHSFIQVKKKIKQRNSESMRLPQELSQLPATSATSTALMKIEPHKLQWPPPSLSSSSLTKNRETVPHVPVKMQQLQGQSGLPAATASSPQLLQFQVPHVSTRTPLQHLLLRVPAPCRQYFPSQEDHGKGQQNTGREAH